MSLLRRMQNDLMCQCRERVAERIVKADTGVYPMHYHCLKTAMGYRPSSAPRSCCYENHLRARHFMLEAVNWAGLRPPAGWLG